jgi:flagellar assembly protein FliH
MNRAMAIIKQAQTDRLVKDAVVLDLGDLKREGERIIAAARAQADQVLAAARAEAARLTGEADARGFEAGLSRGMAEGRPRGEDAGRAEALRAHGSQLETLVEAWTAALDRWVADRDGLILEAHRDLVALAVAIAETIVHRVIEHDPAIIVAQVEDALRLLSTPTAVVVSINPADHPVLEAAIPSLLERLRCCSQISLADDAGVDRGGCIITTAGGTIDAAIATQIGRIVDALLPPRSRVAAVSGAPPEEAVEAETA